MPKITQYTRQVAPQNINVQASPESFGAATGRAMEQSGNVAVEVSDRMAQAAQRLKSREEIITQMRTLDKFNTETMDDFTRSQTEMDLIDPKTSADFNQKTRDKVTEILNSYQGSPEGKVKLEQELLNTSSQYIQQMNSSALGAQRKFVMTKAGDKINQLSSAVAQNPEKINEFFTQANEYLSEISPTLHPEDEMDLTRAAQEQITLSALRTYTDAGRYDDAKSVIDENPYFMQSLSPNSQREILSTIKGGLDARDKELREIRTKTNTIKVAAEELGVDISGAQVFSAVTGIQDQKTPQGKIDEFAKVIGKPPEELSPSIVAKIGYGVDLPSVSEVDFNKEYTPDGKMTPKGIAAKIKQPFEAAAATKTYKDKIDGAISLFRDSGNKQALLSAMITFQKALDEGAVVREGDIALQREAQSISDKISLWVKPGQVIGNELVDEMQATMTDFSNKALASAKTQIEPYVKDAKSRGYRPLDYGLPQEAYNSVFGNITTSETQQTIKQPVNGQPVTQSADEFMNGQ